MPEQKENFLKEIIRFALIALVIVVPVRLYIAQPFIVSGSSMDPTFHNGEYLIVDQLTYAFENPKRGDVVIFRYPKDPKKYFIKRLIGLPGETVSVRGRSVTITNEESPEGFELPEPYVSNEGNGSNFTLTLSPSEYFVMGDNRPASSDSRSWGPLAEEFLIGRAFVRLLPPNSIAVLPGQFRENE